MKIGDYELVNEEKVNRAILGMAKSNGVLAGGVGEDATDEAKIAEYDRLGGLIKLNGDKVKMGSFFDFKNKKPREEPEVILEFNINGKVVEIAASEPLPPVVRAAKEAEQGEIAAAQEESEKPKGAKGNFLGRGRKPKADESEE